MPLVPVFAICMTKETQRIRKESKEMEWISKSMIRKAIKEIIESLKAKVSVLIHAVVVVIRTLNHRGCRDVGRFDIVFPPDKSFGMESEGITHEFGNSGNC